MIRLGTKVTAIEFLERACPTMDQDVTKAFTRILKKQGIKFKFNTKVTASEVTFNGVTLTTEPSKGGASNTMDVSSYMFIVLFNQHMYTLFWPCRGRGWTLLFVIQVICLLS